MYQGYNNIYDNNYTYPYLKRQNNIIDEEIITLVQAVDLIKQSVSDEREDELFYESLLTKVPNEEAKNIIEEIRQNEKKHNEILRFVYSNITGEILPSAQDIEFKQTNTTYLQDLQKALFGELDAVKKYRRIMGAMPSMKTHTLIMSIMTDELSHAAKYNFLITQEKNL